MLGVLTNNRKQRNPTGLSRLDAIPPVSLEAPTEWYEIGLVERGEKPEDLEVKVIRRALEPDITFTEDDGLERETEYAVIYRRVKIDDDGEVLRGSWTDPTPWERPFARRKVNVD